MKNNGEIHRQALSSLFGEEKFSGLSSADEKIYTLFNRQVQIEIANRNDLEFLKYCIDDTGGYIMWTDDGPIKNLMQKYSPEIILSLFGRSKGNIIYRFPNFFFDFIEKETNYGGLLKHYFVYFEVYVKNLV